MTIEQISFHEVIVPAQKGTIEGKNIDKPLHKLAIGAQPGWSVQFDQLSKLIVKIKLSSGITGWGELYRNHDWNIVDSIADILLHADIESLVLQNLPFTYCREYDGFECAVWDAYAKAHNIRVVDLVGGPMHEKIKVGAWSSHREADEIEELAT